MNFNKVEYWENLGFFTFSYLVDSVYSFISYTDAKEHLYNYGLELSEEVFKSTECKLIDLVQKNENGQILKNSYALFLPIQILSKFIV